jgi:hypothetical protein
MKTISYRVQFLNNEGDFENFETFNRLEADLKASECIRNNNSGFLFEIIKVENKEFPQCNKTTKEMIKHW